MKYVILVQAKSGNYYKDSSYWNLTEAAWELAVLTEMGLKAVLVKGRC